MFCFNSFLFFFDGGKFGGFGLFLLFESFGLCKVGLFGGEGGGFGPVFFHGGGGEGS